MLAAPYSNPWQSDYRAPDLVDDIVELLGNASLVLDGTLGGGHPRALHSLGVEKVIRLDRDPDATASAPARLSEIRSASSRACLMPAAERLNLNCRRTAW